MILRDIAQCTAVSLYFLRTHYGILLEVFSDVLLNAVSFSCTWRPARGAAHSDSLLPASEGRVSKANNLCDCDWIGSSKAPPPTTTYLQGLQLCSMQGSVHISALCNAIHPSCCYLPPAQPLLLFLIYHCYKGANPATFASLSVDSPLDCEPTSAPIETAGSAQ